LHTTLTQWHASELQNQYQTYKNTLQQLAQKIGDVEQETEEHKYAAPFLRFPYPRKEQELGSRFSAHRFLCYFTAASQEHQR